MTPDPIKQKLNGLDEKPREEKINKMIKWKTNFLKVISIASGIALILMAPDFYWRFEEYVAGIRGNNFRKIYDRRPNATYSLDGGLKKIHDKKALTEEEWICAEGELISRGKESIGQSGRVSLPMVQNDVLSKLLLEHQKRLYKLKEPFDSEFKKASPSMEEQSFLVDFINDVGYYMNLNNATVTILQMAKAVKDIRYRDHKTRTWLGNLNALYAQGIDLYYGSFKFVVGH